MGMTFAQWWREQRVRLGCRLLKAWLPFNVAVTNEIGCTVAVILCEDEDTYRRRFIIGKRFHVTVEEPTSVN